ncbi:MAG: 50S ribosomal protein L23 [Alphaproteobacteria bacterium]|nr:50S ribosomal protein L23 [Alphaproteobacteria bacterium]
MSWKFLNKKTFSEERILCVIDKPVITEKSTLGAQNNQYTFRVAMDANKLEIKVAVEKMFDVKVEKVNTLVSKGKTKRFRGFAGKRNDWKKAVVSLAQGQSIDVGTGV